MQNYLGLIDIFNKKAYSYYIFPVALICQILIDSYAQGRFQVN